MTYWNSGLSEQPQGVCLARKAPAWRGVRFEPLAREMQENQPDDAYLKEAEGWQSDPWS
ncbi:hypothetical protein [Rothia sp. P4278]|uniref:hypothetical protein n=1 Tax=Rothia sp. P4278 TaxID=3402658 RepID=UPI003AE5D2BF